MTSESARGETASRWWGIRWRVASTLLSIFAVECLVFGLAMLPAAVFWVTERDWDVAGHAYAAAHRGYYEKVRTAVSWFTLVFLQPGPEADAVRDRVMPQLESDAFFLPDTLITGPDLAPSVVIGDGAHLSRQEGGRCLMRGESRFVRCLPHVCRAQRRARAAMPHSSGTHGSLSREHRTTTGGGHRADSPSCQQNNSTRN